MTGAATFAGAVTATGNFTHNGSLIGTSGTTAAQYLSFNSSTGGNAYLVRENSAGTSYAGQAYSLQLYTDSKPIVLAPGGVNKFQIDTSGAATFVGAVATGNLTVTGAITATGNITAYFSDDRLKTRLGPIVDPLGKIKLLTGFYFEPNQTAMDLGYEKKTDVGISAQDVQAIFPEIIAAAPIDSKYMTVRYEKLIPLLIEAIKLQQSQIEHLQSLVQPH